MEKGHVYHDGKYYVNGKEVDYDTWIKSVEAKRKEEMK